MRYYNSLHVKLQKNIAEDEWVSIRPRLRESGQVSVIHQSRFAGSNGQSWLYVFDGALASLSMDGADAK